MIMRRILYHLLLLPILSGCEWLDTKEATYRDYEAAARAGEVAKGWIPTYVPGSAANIRIKYSIDSNQIWLSFRIGPHDISAMLKTCSSVYQSEVAYPRTGPRGWWPITLVSDAQQVDGSYEYYKSDCNGVTVVDKDRAEVFYWAPAPVRVSIRDAINPPYSA